MNEALKHIHQLLLSREIPFVSFRLPLQDHCATWIQTGSEAVELEVLPDMEKEEGFLMAPFDTSNGHPFILIRPDLVLESNQISRSMIRKIEELRAPHFQEWKVEKPVITGREKYMAQVESIRSKIATGAFQKAVLSRIRYIPGNFVSLAPRLYQAFCRRHPNAFVFLIRSGSEYWMGASPEPLLRLREKKVSTVSLAGTRPYAEKHMDVNKWTMKEVLEQEYVTRYIHDVLHGFDIRDYRVSHPYVKRAGNLVHLRTDFSLGLEKINGRLWDLVAALHPTPAVAGQPKDIAIRFIKELEPHDRSYYTGYLGPVRQDREIDLFVNLRSVKIDPEGMSLYVGGGITLDSDPSDEWDETRWKAGSLIKVMRTFIRDLEL